MEQHLGRSDEPLAPSGEHVAHARFAVRLGPGLDERGLARRAGVFVDRLDVQLDGDPQALGRRRRRGDPDGELLEALGRDQVAALAEQLVLAAEVRVDRADRQAALADDVGDGGALVALGPEDVGGGHEDPIADLLLMGGTDSRHIDS